MATITKFISKLPSSLSTTSKLAPPCPHNSFVLPFLAAKPKSLSTKSETDRNYFTTKATAAPGTGKVASHERVQKFHSVEEFDEALRMAKNKLFVVEYAAIHSAQSGKIYPFMVDPSRQCGYVEFSLWAMNLRTSAIKVKI